MFFSSRAAAVTLAALLGGGVAVAMPTTGMSPGPDWAVELAATHSSGKILYPGQGVESMAFTVVNESSRPEKLSEIDASVTEGIDGDAATLGGHAIPGCLARWFRVSLGRSSATPPARLVAPGAVYRSMVLVRMIDAPVNQDPCRGALPAVRLSVS